MSRSDHIAVPFKFLDYFVEADGERSQFYGREAEIIDVVSRITTTRTLVLYGRSGIGKTSLIRAGVIPELRKRRHVPIYVRLAETPLDDLWLAVARVANVEVGDNDLAKLLQSIGKGGPPVVIFDQFEEMFVRFSMLDDREAHLLPMVKAIARILGDSSSNVRVVFSLREDYVANLDDFRDHLGDLLDERFRLHGLTAFGASEAIAQPLPNARIHFSRKLLNGLVDRLAEYGFDPSILQIFCTEVIHNAGMRIELDIDDLNNIGTLDDVFRRYLNRVVAALPSERHIVARMVLDAMITDKRKRRSITLERLVAEASFETNPHELAEVLDVLVVEHAIRREQREDGAWFELIHDMLVEVVLRWLDEDEQFFQYRFARDLVATLSRGRGWRDRPEGLFAKGQLEVLIAPHRERLRLTKDQKEFLLRSAIWSQSAHVGFWANAFGLETSVGIVGGLLGASDVRWRLAAAMSCGWIQDSGGLLGAWCLDAALSDADGSVRRAAGQSLAAHLGAQEVSRLVAAYRVDDTRQNALQVMADLFDARISPWPFGTSEYQVARQASEQRQLEALGIGGTVQRATVTGAAVGLSYAFLWGAPFALFYAWQQQPFDWGERFGQLLGICCLGAPAAGALVGGTSASAARRDALRRAQGYYINHILNLWSLLGLVLVSGAAYLAVKTLLGSSDNGDVIFALAVGLPAIITTLAMGLFLALRSLQGVKQVGRRWTLARIVVAALAVGGFPVLVPVALFILMWIGLLDPNLVIPFSYSVALVSGSALATGIMVTDPLTAGAASVEPEKSRRNLARMALVLVALVAPIALVVFLSRRPEVVPISAPKIDLYQDMKSSFRTHWLIDSKLKPTNQWRRVENSMDSFRFVEFQGDFDALQVGDRLGNKARKDRESLLLAFPPQSSTSILFEVPRDLSNGQALRTKPVSVISSMNAWDRKSQAIIALPLEGPAKKYEDGEVVAYQWSATIPKQHGTNMISGMVVAFHDATSPRAQMKTNAMGPNANDAPSVETVIDFNGYGSLPEPMTAQIMKKDIGIDLSSRNNRVVFTRGTLWIYGDLKGAVTAYLLIAPKAPTTSLDDATP